jgi:hypothetical protein
LLAAKKLKMNIEDRIRTFALLGVMLHNEMDGIHGPYSDQFNIIIDRQHLVNPWFTSQNVRDALKAIAGELKEDVLRKWTDAYPELSENRKPLRAGVIMAGNIPLVGFFDFLAVLISGNILVAKTSSKDSELILYISKILCDLNPGFRGKIEFTEGTLVNFDVVIATGSNNSSRYFEYYFSKYPNIIRKNRTSIAILDGNESTGELKDLGKDIFSYFGLGCRNVSKIYIPRDYDYTGLAEFWNEHANIIKHQKYANNYDFNKAVYIVNREKFYDTGYLLIKEDRNLSSPVSVLFAEYYDSKEMLKHLAENHSNTIQCIISRDNIPFGSAQAPHPWDYSDGVDTIEFLLKKNTAGIS